MKTTQKILFGLLVGGVAAGGYYLYQKNKNRLNPENPESDTLEPDPNSNANTSINTQSAIATGQSFTDKIKRIQKAIRVTADGKMGPKTIAQLKKFITPPATINSSNIDGLLKILEPVAGVVWSLDYHRNDKDLQWWWDWARKDLEKKGIKFSDYVPGAYANVTGRSAYTDYKITPQQGTRAQWDSIRTASSVKGLGDTITLTKLI